MNAITLRAHGSWPFTGVHQERRAYRRVRSRGAAALKLHDGCSGVQGVLLNISQGGAAIIYHPESLGEYDPVEPNQVSRSDLSRPGSRVFLDHFPAVTVYRRPIVRQASPTLGSGSCIQCGLVFERLTELQQQQLDILISHHTEEREKQ